MDADLERDIRDLLLRCIREHEEEWLAIEAESLLKRMNQEPDEFSDLGHGPIRR